MRTSYWYVAALYIPSWLGADVIWLWHGQASGDDGLRTTTDAGFFALLVLYVLPVVCLVHLLHVALTRRKQRSEPRQRPDAGS